MKQPQNRKLKIAHAYKSQNANIQPSSTPIIQSSPLQDQIRHLKNELERYKIENTEILEEKSGITQRYLLAKSQVKEVLLQLDSIKIKLQSQDEIILKKVEQSIARNYQKLLNCNQQQNHIILKLKQQKTSLCKNIWDLQERLKLTRIELQQTQNTLFSLQKVEQSTVNCNDQTNNKPIVTSNNKIFPCTNKIQNFSEKMDNLEQISSLIWNTGNSNIDSDKQQELSFQRPVGGRNTLTVAKSLAIHRNTGKLSDESDTKYNWLFNDDEAPRDQDKFGLDLPQNGVNIRSQKYVEPPENQLSQDHSNFAVQTEALKSGKSTAFEPDTQQSDRSNIYDGLIDSKNENDKSNINRPSLVDKSFQGMKNIFKLAKAGDYNGIIGQSHYDKNRNSITREIDHETVELELNSQNYSRNEQNPLDAGSD